MSEVETCASLLQQCANQASSFVIDLAKGRMLDVEKVRPSLVSASETTLVRTEFDEACDLKAASGTQAKSLLGAMLAS